MRIYRFDTSNGGIHESGIYGDWVRLSDAQELEARVAELEAETNEQNANLIEQARLHANELGAKDKRIQELEAYQESYEKELTTIEDITLAEHYPRAYKLMKKGVEFMVVKCSEPYAPEVAGLIREAEQEKGTWTAADLKWVYDQVGAILRPQGSISEHEEKFLTLIQEFISVDEAAETEPKEGGQIDADIRSRLRKNLY